MNRIRTTLAVALALSATGALAQQAPSTMPSTSGTTAGSTTTAGGAGFTRELQQAQYLASRLDGADVYNGQDEKIADVEDMVIDTAGDVVAVILAYGGVAGVGQSYVAVQPSQLQMSKDDDGAVRVKSTLTLDQLRAAPTFSYSNSR